MARSSASDACGRYVAASWYRSAITLTSAVPPRRGHEATVLGITSSATPQSRMSSASKKESDAPPSAAGDADVSATSTGLSAATAVPGCNACDGAVRAYQYAVPAATPIVTDAMTAAA